jgi:hypothetical protein
MAAHFLSRRLSRRDETGRKHLLSTFRHCPVGGVSVADRSRAEFFGVRIGHVV